MDEQPLKYFGSEYLSNSLPSNVLIILTLFFVFLIGFLQNPRKKKYCLPPGPTGIPVFGYIPFLGKEPFKTLDSLKLKYGNVFSLNMAGQYTVILADFTAVKDAFSKNTTLDRPEDVFSFLPDGVGFSSVNGQEWVEQRKFCLKSIRELGVGRHEWETNIQEEVEDFIKIIDDNKGQPLDASDILTSSVSNNVSFFVFGRKLDYHDPHRRFFDSSLDQIMKAFLLVSFAPYFPRIRDFIASLGVGSVGKARKDLKRFNHIIRKEVEKHRSSYKAGNPTNFIDDYLQEMDNYKGKDGHTFVERNLIGNVQALYLASSDTTRTSINWLLLAMAEFQDIQAKVHQEIPTVVATEQQITWSSRNRFPYTMAVILEGQRWKTIAPLNTTRKATEDIKIQGYDIPKGTAIIANNWGLHNDAKSWKNPGKFDPHHFLTEDGTQVNMKPDSYVPFSYGKRGCPGETIALMEIFLYFTAIMLKFQVLPPEGQKIKFDAILGLTYIPVKQKLRFVPRISNH